jgi:hypothetical protein
MNDHWPGNRCSWSSEQRRKASLDPRQRSVVRLFGSGKIFEVLIAVTVSSGA